jgi:hypothetical protein
MRCIVALTEQPRQRMYELLALDVRLHCDREPVVCLDEKSTRLLADSRAALPMRPGRPGRQDYECRRQGTYSLFVAVEPHAGRRCVLVTERRAKLDFARFTRNLLEYVYRSARRVHLGMDNLRSCFEEVLGVNAAQRLRRRVEFHYTPKHASWLNMAEIEIGVLTRQCLDRRMPDLRTVRREISAGLKRRNASRCTIEWSFTRQDTDRKMRRHYVPLLTC